MRIFEQAPDSAEMAMLYRHMKCYNINTEEYLNQITKQVSTCKQVLLANGEPTLSKHNGFEKLLQHEDGIQ